MPKHTFRSRAAVCLAWPLLVSLAVPLASGAGDAEAGKVPVTTKSQEALKLYLEGRNLQDKLRATDARGLFEQAVTKDEDFALAHLALANTAPTNREFFAALDRAVALVDQVSEGERHMILAVSAAVRSDPAAQEDHLTRLVAAYPGDERARNLLGTYFFALQDYEAAIAQYEKAIATNPGFSQPYNQVGYAYRFQGRYEQAEKAFRRYIELIPDDPNPYDSYAELLMKTGRFEESIAQYQKALSVDPHFAASYVGIGIDQTLMGQPQKARETFGKLGQIARNDGERRQALARAAWSYVDERQHPAALEQARKMYALAEKGGDGSAMAGDLVLMGNIQLDAGQLDEASASFTKSVVVMAGADVPEAVKEAAERNSLFNLARVDLARPDVAAAQARAKEYAQKVSEKKVPFEVWQSHELQGLVALAEKDFDRAIAELGQANQQDPRVLFHLALAHHGKGDTATAKEVCRRAADDNGLSFNYAYVRGKARKLLAEL
jgi:tetratricopeptide (TPR) repeat protein